MSFADYLGLNEDSLRELEDGAMQRASEADQKAQGAFGNAYQQANADVAAGGQGDLTQQRGYMDFVRAQREAAAARTFTGNDMSPEEAAARGAMRQAAPQAWKPNVGAYQGRLNDMAAGRDAGRTAQKAYADKMKGEREAQDRAFNEAQGRWSTRNESDMAGLQPAIDRATGWSQYESSGPDAPDQQAAAQRREFAQSELRYYGGQKARMAQNQSTFGKKA